MKVRNWPSTNAVASFKDVVYAVLIGFNRSKTWIKSEPGRLNGVFERDILLLVSCS